MTEKEIIKELMEYISEYYYNINKRKPMLWAMTDDDDLTGVKGISGEEDTQRRIGALGVINDIYRFLQKKL